MSFAELIAGSEAMIDGLALDVPETWHQGRTAYGGFSAAVALQAALRVAADVPLPPLRSAVVSFVGPAYGGIECRARLLRRGKNATWIGAEITRDGETVLTATFVFMGPVESALHLNDCALPPETVPCVEAEAIRFNPHSPGFLRNHFEARHGLSRGGDPQPQLCRWVRLCEREGLAPMTELLLLADALPPGVLPLLTPATPVSSMTWQVNLLTPLPQTMDGWYLLRSVGDYAESGCSSQTMQIWNLAGEPIVTGMQSVALFG